MLSNRLYRVQWNIDRLEEIQHFKFNNDISEDKIRIELSKLNNLIENIIGKVNAKNKNKNNSETEIEESDKKLTHNIKMGNKNQLNKNKNEDDKIKSTASTKIKNNVKLNIDTDRDRDDNLSPLLEEKNNNPTEFKEFNLGKRERKIKETHKVYKFSEIISTGIKDKKLKIVANLSSKKLLILLSSIYEEKLTNDNINKLTLAEFIYDN